GDDEQGKRRRTEDHGDIRQLQRIDSDDDEQGSSGDCKRVDDAEARILNGLEILAPVPAKALRREIGKSERNLQCGAETGDSEADDEEGEAPLAESIGQHHRRLTITIDGDAPWSDNHRSDDQDGGRDGSAE